MLKNKFLLTFIFILVISNINLAVSPAPFLKEEQLSNLKDPSSIGYRSWQPLTPSGTIETLVIPVEFKNLQFSLDDEKIKELIAKSVSYWQVMSNHKLNFKVTISNKVLLPKDYLEYDSNSLLDELAQNLPMDSKDLANYKLLIVLHAGSGAEAIGYGIWSEYKDTSFFNFNGVIIAPESESVFTSFGTIAHEIGHAFGLPDLYDTSSYKASAVGNWGLMGSGSWLGGCASPAMLTFWSRRYLKFDSGKLINATYIEKLVYSYSDNELPTFYVIPASSEDLQKLQAGLAAEYFLIGHWHQLKITDTVNIKLQSDKDFSKLNVTYTLNGDKESADNFDGYIIYHIDEKYYDSNHDGILNIADESFYTNRVNINFSHKLVDVVCADSKGGLDDLDLRNSSYFNRGDKDDLFDSTFSFTPYSIVNSRSYLGIGYAFVENQNDDFSFKLDEVIKASSINPENYIKVSLIKSNLIIEYDKNTYLLPTITLKTASGIEIGKNYGTNGYSTLNVSNLKPGIYFLILEDQNGKKLKKKVLFTYSSN